MSELLPTDPAEEIWIGITRYKNAKECEQVMNRVDKDPRIEQCTGVLSNC